MCSTRKNILKHIKTILPLLLAPCAAVCRRVLGKHIWAGKSHHRILHIALFKLCQGWSRALPPAPELAGTGLACCCSSHPCPHSCPGLPKTNQGLGTPGHGWSSCNQQEPVVPRGEAGELRTSAGRERGTRSQAWGHHGTAKPSCAQPGTSATGKANPTVTTAQPKSCSRGSKSQQTHPRAPGRGVGSALQLDLVDPVPAPRLSCLH